MRVAPPVRPTRFVRRPAVRARSLRRRIPLLTGGIAVLVAGGTGWLVHANVKAQMLEQASGSTLDRARFAARSYQPSSEPFGGVAVDPPDAPRAFREAVLRDRRVAMEVRGADGPEMWGGVRVDGRRILVASVSLRREYAELRRLDAAMAASGGLAVGVAVPLGALIAGRMSRRLREASATARRIADGDLDARIGGKERPGDEIAELSAAVDSMASALQTRLHGEQRFTADVHTNCAPR